MIKVKIPDAVRAWEVMVLMVPVKITARQTEDSEWPLKPANRR